jgi:hypothetical protein
MKLNKILLGTAAAAGLLAVSAVNAQAAIACVGPVCWHTHEAYDYPPMGASSFIQTIGAGAPMKNTHGASTKAVATGAVRSGWNGRLINIGASSLTESFDNFQSMRVPGRRHVGRAQHFWRPIT